MLSSVCRIILFVVVVVCLADTNDDRQCVVDSPAGNVSLVLDVRGTPGPEGPRGLRGPRGKQGETGMKGDRGAQGEKGVRGDTGPIGPNGLTGEAGSKGQKGAPGRQGLLGPTGPAGPTGPQGFQGEPGDTVLTDDEFNRIVDIVANKLNESIIAELVEANKVLSARLHSLEAKNIPDCEKNSTRNMTTLCNITSDKWRRIAYFDTTLGHPCPSGLRTVTNTTTKQTACGTTTKGRVRISMNFSTGGNYTNVCGRARGYSYDELGAFYHYRSNGQRTIDSNYVDGISITKGSPRQHLWTYAAGLTETDYRAYYSCPCARSNYNTSWIPNFVGNNYYCESGFVDNWANRIVWEDPLWDGEGCHASGNRCCDRYGWFHRQVPPSSDDVEVRWCKYWGSNEEFFTDQLEIWVM